MALQTSSICSSREVAERNPKTDFEVMAVVAVHAADFFSAIRPLILLISLFWAFGLLTGLRSLGASLARLLAWQGVNRAGINDTQSTCSRASIMLVASSLLSASFV